MLSTGNWNMVYGEQPEVTFSLSNRGQQTWYSRPSKPDPLCNKLNYNSSDELKLLY